MPDRRGARLPSALLVLAQPTIAHAHAFEAGQGGYALFLEGAALPFHTPELALSVVALALLVGAWRTDGMPVVWPALIGGALAGIALAAIVAVDPTWLLYGLALALGLLAVLARTYRPGAMRAAAGLAGAAIAYGASAEHGAGALPFAVVAGIFAGLNFAVAALAGLASLPGRTIGAAWPAIGLRVAASWLVAVAMMMLAFAATS